MRIFQVVTQLEPGGAQRVAIQLTRGLHDRGHHVTCLALYDKSPTDTEGVTVSTLRTRRTGAAGLPGLVVDLRRIMRHECDVFVGHGRYANVIGALGALLAGVPVRVAVQHSRLTKPRGLVQHLDAWWGTLGVFTHVVSVGREAADSGRFRSRRYRRRLCVITNGVGLPDPSRSRSEVRADLGVPDEALVAIHVGRWSAAKNQLTVLEVAARLPQIYFVLAGPMQPEFDHPANVRMVGALDRVALSSLMHAADLMICPSRNEAMPLVLLEGLSTGLAVVASDIPPHREILGTSAICVAPTDVAKWVELLTALAGDAAQLAAERAQAIQLAVGYSLDRMVDDYEDLLDGAHPLRRR